MIRIVLTFFLFFSSLESFEFKTYYRNSIEPHVKAINDLALTVYREHPYNYAGTEEEYLPFIQYYCHSGIATALFEDGKLIGIAIGMPLSEMRDKYRLPFIQARPQTDDSTVYYLGEFLLLKEYRKQGFGKGMYFAFEDSVRNMGLFSEICFCKIDERNIKGSNDYQPLDGFWKRLGFEVCHDVSCTVYWQNSGDLEESEHHLVYFNKQL